MSTNTFRDVAKLRTRETAGELPRASQLIAGSNPVVFDGLNFEGQANAPRKLCAVGPPRRGFGCAEDQLIAAAVIIAAELKVPPAR